MTGIDFDLWGKGEYDDAEVGPSYDDQESADEQASSDRVKIRADELRAQLLDHDGLRKIPEFEGPGDGLIAELPAG